MKAKALLLSLALAALPLGMAAQTSFLNLTPRPVKSTYSASSKLTLPESFEISVAGLPDSLVAEAERFATDFNAVTGYSASVSASAASPLITVTQDASLKNEGYTATVTTEGVTLTAKTTAGLYYAFQTVKKLLPANVMAGVKDASVTAYTLPVTTITDYPRFDYRGFMLDVSRHFFTVDEVKRMIDVMSFYKMNRFHWHLSDDQGWRVEIKKYPKLTTVGATAPNSRFTDMYSCTQYWINQPYGPYYYTQEQIKEVVAYAKERHIEVVPEIDMPGHFCAALAAYPEFSCTPDGSHTVQVDGGIYSDVLNVGDTAAVQFCKDVLSELMELFPGEYIHIGGDECPTSAWQSNAKCQAAYAALGLTDYRQLQSHFIKELGDFVEANGHKLAVWNEAISASGADTDLVKATGATVYCWTSPEAAVTKAQTLGLKSIYTPWGPYYINRKQGSASYDPPGAGSGSDDVQATYNQSIPTATSYGVQGTFWCEHVSDADYMEWLALPRLIAVAEAGWTPQARRTFSDFQKRMTADTLLLDYGGYKYCRYHMLVDNDGYPTTTTAVDTVRPKVSTADASYYYRLVSGCTDAARVGRCIELLSENSSLITEYSGKNAAAGRLWTNTQAAEGDDNYDYQWWTLEADPSGSGKYAIVCKAVPAGSVNPTPTAITTSGRWEYDSTTKHYNFTLGVKGYGAKGNNYYYTISSDQVNNRYWNSAAAAQGLSVNPYANPSDGSSGYWEFSPMADYGWDNPASIEFDGLEQGKTYVFRNTVEGFDSTAIADIASTSNTTLYHDTDAYALNAWTVVSAGEAKTDGTQAITLKNAVTGRYISNTSSYVSQQGFPVTVGTSAGSITLQYDPELSEYRLKLNSHSLFPVPSTGAVNSGSTISGASYDAPRLQGATWTAQEVNVLTLTCVDDLGASLGVYTRSVPVTTELTASLCPAVKNCEVQSITKTADNAYTITYKRTAYSVTLKCVDSRGAIVSSEETAVAVGSAYTVSLPTPKYFTFESADVADGTSFTPTADSTIVVNYTTDAIIGASALGDAITSLAGLKNGNSYVLRDDVTGTDAARAGYRRIVPTTNAINKVNTVEELDPTAVWTFEGSNKTFKVKNEYLGLYVPALVNSTATTASKSGANFTFTLNDDGETWALKGTNGLYWDGLANGALVGWGSNNGHPIRIYEYFAEPYYTVIINCVDEEGTALTTTTDLVAAGSAYTLSYPTISGYVFKSATGTESFTGTVEGYLTITATYADAATGISTVTTDATRPTAIYDLSGRRLRAVAGPGIYIINGQKVIVK